MHGLTALIIYWNGWAKGLLWTQHLILSYEGMLSQTEKSVAEILNFIGLAINTSALRNAIAAAQFDRMQEQERAQGIPGHEYDRSEEHTSELQSLMRISYAVFCLKKKKHISMKRNSDKNV